MLGQSNNKMVEMLSEMRAELRMLCASIARHEEMLNSDSPYSLPNRLATHELRLATLEANNGQSKVTFDRILLIGIAIMGAATTLFTTLLPKEKENNAPRPTVVQAYHPPESGLD